MILQLMAVSKKKTNNLEDFLTENYLYSLEPRLQLIILIRYQNSELLAKEKIS